MQASSDRHDPEYNHAEISRAIASIDTVTMMELSHENRLATLGYLAASITHEMKQPIAAAVTNAMAGLHWLDRPRPDLDRARAAFDRIVRDGNRASNTLGRIRALIRKAPPQTDRLEINEAILEVIELTCRETTKNAVSVRTDLADGLPLIEGDRVQLQQVALNLIINAVEAMSGVSAGARELLVSTGRTETGDVRVTVRDSGPGVDPDSVNRLFEAFYTTKPSGTGIGLAICRSIVEAHGGRLWVETNQPQGAVFQFTVPAA
ncbi:sensor histidine kinase [Inquilinus sp. OTU3971]|uniref:sensor histidine kinase n=1 Tax=Inquilinus sp. OTU3971 TaxID=3043855 RepID=UPI00313B29CC